MKELRAVLRALRDDQPSVLATLVKVEGSSYRRVGARLLYQRDGNRIGSISGGCLEDDLVERARAVLSSGKSETVVYDTTSENDLVWGVGLGCHGIVHVTLERVTGLGSEWSLLEMAWAQRRAAALAIAFGREPGAARLLGAARLSADRLDHTASLPAELAPALRECLMSQKNHYTDFQGASVLCEFIPPPLRLVIFGAGNDVIPLARLAKELGWSVSVRDPRAAYATPQRFPGADDVAVLAPDAANTLSWDALTAAVVMTHHYRFDLPLIRALLPLELSYLGLLGPKKRAEKILGDAASSGLAITNGMRARLHAPVGLDLGGNGPEEVALAIVAEIQATFAARNARPLRERQQPIHDQA